MSRIISGLIAISYILFAVFRLGYGQALKLIVLSLLAVGCIWFGESLGGYTGFVGIRHIARPTPGKVVRFFGWLLLAVPPIFWLAV
jgi:hypothetical protein